MRCIERFFLTVLRYCLLLGLLSLPAAAASDRPPQASHPEVHRLQLLTARAAEAYRAGRLGHALALAEAVADGAKLGLGSNHLRYAQALNNLALLQDLAGALAQAERNYRNAIRIVEALEGGHAGQLAELKNNLAAVVLQQCHINEARTLYAEGLQFAVAAYGARHRETEMVRANIDRLDHYMTGQQTGPAALADGSGASPVADVANMLEGCIS